MVSVEEATGVVLSNLFKPPVHVVDLNDAYGAVLGAPISADRDFPPFNRVAMDGIALWFSELKNGRKEFTIEGIQRAGQPPVNLSDVKNAIEVMTGAVLPEGTNTVIRYEDIVIQKNVATIMSDAVKEGHHIHRQGSDAKQDDILLTPGMILSPAEIALLASVGRSDVPVFSFPKAAIISSGDELVEVNEIPELHQIRRSNTYAIQAAMKNIGWNGTQYHLHDQKDFVIDSLKVIEAAHDVLIISGGVSKGRFDFIPEALEAIGVKKLVHQVSQRPGKPFWFGVSKSGKTVFALPGNPVSTYMCFYRYVMPWLYKSLGVQQKAQWAVLGDAFSFEPDLTYFVQVSVCNENGLLVATPEVGGGSGDFANLKRVDGFLELPKGRKTFNKGEPFPYWSFR
ncbi:molybdopterin molybdotransferase MoeA [Pseudochryseolinea flava]|uniref:Molybdopterin molybdenumtransferase n=1 Tax=Pseudochryseolinea flava TaxID=2059302 RepID=A0A364Y2E9_9BACT|nr:molybdopterin molybdotransferase MoeA [Pseudochryseolinea flava]RAW01045.1 molybdopterin molybdenumtransferase MoeA [Pseudochryseolinea flava]